MNKQHIEALQRIEDQFDLMIEQSMNMLSQMAEINKSLLSSRDELREIREKGDERE